MTRIKLTRKSLLEGFMSAEEQGISCCDATKRHVASRILDICKSKPEEHVVTAQSEAAIRNWIEALPSA